MFVFSSRSPHCSHSQSRGGDIKAICSIYSDLLRWQEGLSHTKTIHMHRHRALTLKGTLSWCFCVAFPFCALESLCLMSNRFKVIFRGILVLYFQSSQQNDKWRLFCGVLYPTPPKRGVLFECNWTFFYLTFNTASGCQHEYTTWHTDRLLLKMHLHHLTWF